VHHSQVPSPLIYTSTVYSINRSVSVKSELLKKLIPAQKTRILDKDFKKDKKTINAVIRSLEVIGEATKKVSEDLREGYLQIPWKRMAGMSDK